MDAELLDLAMRSPDTIGDLLTIVFTDDDQMVDPRASVENALACRRLEARLAGQAFDPDTLDARAASDLLGGGKDSDVFLDLHYSARRYLAFLADPEQYPENLRARADADFPPLGHDPRWTVPDGFRQEGGVLGWVHAATSPNVECRLRRGRLSPTVIMIERPSSTELRYPWQQAIGAHRALFGPGSRFQRIATRYVAIGRTRAFEVCYRDGPFEIVKLPVLIEPGTERMFEFHTPSLREEKRFFDAFVAALR